MYPGKAHQLISQSWMCLVRVNVIITPRLRNIREAAYFPSLNIVPFACGRYSETRRAVGIRLEEVDDGDIYTI